MASKTSVNNGKQFFTAKHENGADTSMMVAEHVFNEPLPTFFLTLR